MKTFNEWASDTKFADIVDKLEPMAKDLSKSVENYPSMSIKDAWDTVVSLGKMGNPEYAGYSLIVTTAISQLYECLKENE